MKRNVLYNLALLPLALLFATFAMSQQMLADDQNPNYMVSQAKYTKMADSINSWHGTTPQETYKAVDWVADRAEARAQRRAFRQQLRMERARYGGYYYDDYNYGYNNGYNNFYPGYYNSSYYPVYGRGYRSRWNQHYWNALPLAATIAWWSWRR